MSYLNKIEALNNYKSEGKIALIVDGQRVGQVQEEYLDICKDSIFAYKNGVLEFKQEFNNFEKRSKALDILTQILLEKKIIKKVRDEKYALIAKFGEKPYAVFEREISTFLGVIT